MERHEIYRRYGKRLIDIILSSVSLLLLLPLFILIAAWIKVDSKGPVMFKQKRVGINKSFFSILKFRTMRIDAPKDVPTHMLNDPDVFITRIGRFLRKTSLDELPQIWNILIGKMSIIGPRPALWNQYDLVAERDKYGANGIRPGLTGWAQVNGRDELEIEEKAKLDGNYSKNISLHMDFVCFLNSIFVVLRCSGIIEGGTGMLKRRRNSMEEKAAIDKFDGYYDRLD
jgi:O-antigen biosynthesis protein WbqP